MCPSCIWHFGDGIRLCPTEHTVWAKQLFMTQRWSSRHCRDKGRVAFMQAPCGKMDVLHWCISDVSDWVSNLFVSCVMTSERTRRSLTWRKLTKGEVFSQKGCLLEGGVVRWERWDSASVCRKAAICWAFARLCVHQIRNEQLQLVCFVLGCFD